MAPELKNYEPLFLKYRPQSLDELVGQESVKQTLKNAIFSKKLVNAYLFTGPRGTGKTSTARIFAKSLNCLGDGSQQAGPTVTPCQKCASCVGIVNSTSLDVIEIDAASHGNVDDARALIEKVNLVSVAGNYKIYIIDEVHMLSTAAFNALLKVFEEPPEKVIFILATTEEDKVLPTIVSRCQKFSFRPISLADEVKRLKEVAQKEKIEIDEAALEFIAKRSDGGMRDALSLLDQLSVFGEKITLDKVLDLVGGISFEDLEILQKSLYERDAKKTLEQLDGLYGKGKEAIQVCRELNNYLLGILESGAHNFENFELVQMIDGLADLEYKIKQSSQSKNLLRATLLKICHRQDFAVMKDLLARLEALEQNKLNGGFDKTAQFQSLKLDNNFDRAASAHSVPVSDNKSNNVNFRTEKSSKGSALANNENSKPDLVKVDQQKSLENKNSTDDFLDYLSPACKGIFISSKAYLSSIENNLAIISIPAKFKFLKSKLEAKSDELLSAIKKSNGDNISSLNFLEVDEDRVEDPYKSESVNVTKPVIKPFLKNEPVTSKLSASKAQNSNNDSFDEIEISDENTDDDEKVVLEKENKSTKDLEAIDDNGSFKPRAGTGNHKLDEAIKMTIDTFGGKAI